jgi:hypothetical protein
VVASAKSANPVKLAVSSSGYVVHEDAKGKHPLPNQWEITWVPFTGGKKTLVEVESICTPAEQFLKEDTLLVTTCTGHSPDREGQAVTLDGKVLWQGGWDATLVWPSFALSTGGRDFAVEWLRVSHPVDEFYSLGDEDVQGQVVQVLSTATGKLLMSSYASPVYTGGQNFALSADGRRFAVLRLGNIEVYEVPDDQP